MRKISMSYLTAPVADPLDALRIAHDAGYDGIGVRLCDPLDGALSPLVTDTAIRDAFLTRLDESGLVLTEVEAWMLRSEAGPATDPRVFETAAQLGQPGLIAVGDLAGTVTVPQMCAAFARLCRDASVHGLTVGFEPIAHRAGGTLDDALAIAGAGAELGATLVLDALHVDRMGLTPEALEAIEPALVPIFHICDAPAGPQTQDRQIDQSAFNRWAPGAGELTLDAYLDALPAGLPISLEIPMSRLEGQVPPAERARQVLMATRSWLARRSEAV